MEPTLDIFASSDSDLDELPTDAATIKKTLIECGLVTSDEETPSRDSRNFYHGCSSSKKLPTDAANIKKRLIECGLVTSDEESPSRDSRNFYHGSTVEEEEEIKSISSSQIFQKQHACRAKRYRRLNATSYSPPRSRRSTDKEEKSSFKIPRLERSSRKYRAPQRYRHSSEETQRACSSSQPQVPIVLSCTSEGYTITNGYKTFSYTGIDEQWMLTLKSSVLFFLLSNPHVKIYVTDDKTFQRFHRFRKCLKMKRHMPIAQNISLGIIQCPDCCSVECHKWRASFGLERVLQKTLKKIPCGKVMP